MEKVLLQIADQLGEIKSDIKQINHRLDHLETDVKGIKEEHGLILRTLLESKEIKPS